MPSDSQLKIELQEYFVETPKRSGPGTFQYLSIENRDKYLAKKGIVKLGFNGETIVLQNDLTGEVPFLKWRDRIDDFIHGKKYKEEVKPNVKPTNQVNEITADEISI